jgi:replicative DNA helicase
MTNLKNTTQNTLTQENKEELERALFFVDCKNVDYETWIKLGTAIKTSGLGYEVFDKWNQTDTQRYDSKLNLQHWNSFKVGETKPGTIIYYAKQYGYVSPYRTNETFTDIPKNEQEPQSQNELSKEDMKEIQETIRQAQERLDLPQGQETITYLLNRGIKYTTAKEYGLGSYCNDYGEELLLIPSTNGYKLRYLDDSHKNRYPVTKGTRHLFNEKALDSSLEEPLDPIFVCEGQLDALSIIQEGYKAIALSSTNNAQRFVDQYNYYNCKAPLILCLDNDHSGQKATNTIKKRLSDTPIRLFNIPTQYNDINDYYLNNLTGIRESLKKAYRKYVKPTKEELLEEYSNESNANLLDTLGETFSTQPISTGFKNLDFLLSGGLYDGLYVLGANTGQGKTTYALQMIDQIAQQGHDVLIFTLEMSKSELLARSISRHTYELSKSVTSRFDTSLAKTEIEIRRTDLYNNMTNEELETIQKAKEEYRAYGSHIHTFEGIGSISAEVIRNVIERHIKLTGNKPVVMVDYIQLLAPMTDKYTDTKESMDKNILELKRITRDLKTPIIAISSMNRGAYGKQADNSNFKESGSIEYTASVTMQLSYREKTDEKEEQQKHPRDIELHIMKNRQGVPGGTIKYKYYSKFNKFEELGQDKVNESKPVLTI